jgi:ATP-dependent Clp protease ATP-binding subunit ClpC
MKERVHEQIERVFRPEFVGRCDDIIVFRHLTDRDLESVVDLELKKVRDRLFEKGLKLLLSGEARAHLIKKGSNLDFGARPLRRAIEGSVEDPLSEELLKGEFEGKEVVAVDVKTVGDKKQLIFEGKMFDEVDDLSKENLNVLYAAPKRNKETEIMLEKPEHCVG